MNGIKRFVAVPRPRTTRGDYTASLKFLFFNKSTERLRELAVIVNLQHYFNETIVKRLVDIMATYVFIIFLFL